MLVVSSNNHDAQTPYWVIDSATGNPVAKCANTWLTNLIIEAIDGVDENGNDVSGNDSFQAAAPNQAEENNV